MAMSILDLTLTKALQNNQNVNMLWLHHVETADLSDQFEDFLMLL